MSAAERTRPALFLVPLVVGIILRSVGLTAQPLWIDEILTLQAAELDQPFRLGAVLQNPQGPLPQILLRLWTALCGTGDPALRAWSAAASILGLGAAILVFRSLAPRAALLAAWLYALSPYQIWYAHEVRNYAFLLAAAVVALWSFESVAAERSGRRWILHGFVLATAALCNLSGLFLLPALGLAVSRCGRVAAARWAGAAVLAVLLVSPWVFEAVRGHMEWSGVTGTDPAGEPIRGGRTFELMGVPYAYAVFLGGYGLGPPLRELHRGLSAEAWSTYAPFLALGAIGVVLALRGLWDLRTDGRVRTWILVAFLPGILVAGVAALGLKAFNPRYLSVSQPAFLLLLAAGVMELGRRRPRLAAAAGGLLICSMLYGAGRQAFDSRYAKDDFRGVAGYLDSSVTPRDLVIEQGVSGPLARYYGGPAPVVTFYATYLRDESRGRERLAEWVRGRDEVYWVGSRLWYEDPDRRVLSWLTSMGTTVASREWVGVEVRRIRLGDAGK